MTTPQPSGPEPDDLGLLGIVPPDESAIRRAVRRGVWRVGFAAVAWLLLVAVLATVGWLVLGAVGTPRFGRVALHGVESAHPEYEVAQGLFSNFGNSTMELQLRPRGQIGYGGAITGYARQPVFGAMQLDLGDPTRTPVAQALLRGPVSNTDTAAYLDGLPNGVSASAIVEFAAPLDQAGLATFAQLGSGASFSAVFLTAAYSSGHIVSWPSWSDLGEFTAWANDLGSADDADLAVLGLPTAATMTEIARNPQIYAVIVDRGSLPQLRSMLASPLVRSLNVIDVGFDPADQSQHR